MEAKSLKIKNESMFYPNDMIELNFFFLTAIWLTHGQLWAILKGTASLTRC